MRELLDSVLCVWFSVASVAVPLDFGFAVAVARILSPKDNKPTESQRKNSFLVFILFCLCLFGKDSSVTFFSSRPSLCLSNYNFNFSLFLTMPDILLRFFGIVKAPARLLRNGSLFLCLLIPFSIVCVARRFFAHRAVEVHPAKRNVCRGFSQPASEENAHNRFGDRGRRLPFEEKHCLLKWGKRS